VAKKMEFFYDKISQMDGNASLEVIPGEGHMAFHPFQCKDK